MNSPLHGWRVINGYMVCFQHACNCGTNYDSLHRRMYAPGDTARTSRERRGRLNDDNQVILTLQSRHTRVPTSQKLKDKSPTTWLFVHLACSERLIAPPYWTFMWIPLTKGQWCTKLSMTWRHHKFQIGYTNHRTARKRTLPRSGCRPTLQRHPSVSRPDNTRQPTCHRALPSWARLLDRFWCRQHRVSFCRRHSPLSRRLSRVGTL